MDILKDVVEYAPMIKMLPKGIISSMASSLGTGVDNIRARFTISLSDHVNATKRRCAYVRTLTNPDIPTDLNDIYVNLYVQINGVQFRDEDLILSEKARSRLLIVGTGGAGKSMIMKKMALLSLTDAIDKVPLFVELRDFKSPAETTFFDNLWNLVTSEAGRKDRAIFDEAFKLGSFIIFLDGLDEVDPNSREEVKRQIDDIIQRFPDQKIIIASRPEVDFAGWHHFDIAHLSALNAQQTRQIIVKCPFDDDLKQSFLEKLDSGSFAKHQSFLQVPLTVVVLLVVYGEFLDLDEHLTSFYDQAYEVLYRRHDRIKGLKRSHFSKLPPDDFRKLLRAFCYRSLVNADTAFTEDSLSNYIARASIISGVTVDNAAYAQDLINSVSLLHRDGSKLYFIHRSFQEYFGAEFIARYKGTESFKVYDALVPNMIATNISPMLKIMDFDALEREWTVPALDSVLKKVESCDGDFAKVANLIFSTVGLMINSSTDTVTIGGYGWSDITPSLYALDIIYGNPDISITQIEFGSASKVIDAIDDSILLVDRHTLQDYEGRRNQPVHIAQIHAPFEAINWLTKTEFLNSIAKFVAKIRAHRDNVNRRVIQNSARSVFD
ncbi:NACHT domain-containing protein [Sphingomonas sp. 22L2VL55-3]